MTHQPSHLWVLIRALLATLLLQTSTRAATPPGLPEPGTPDAAGLEAANAAIGPAFKGQRWDEVLELGKRAYVAGGGADALETVAVAALRLGHATLAFGAYEAIVADPTAPPKTVTRAQNQLKALKSQVASITLTTKPEGAEVEIRGVGAGTSPLAAPLRAFPGKVELAATFGDGTRVTRTVDAKLNVSLSVELVGPESDPPVAAVVAAPLLAPAAVPSSPPPPPPPAPPTTAPAAVPPTAAPAAAVPAAAPPASESETPTPAPARVAQVEAEAEFDASTGSDWNDRTGWNLEFGIHGLLGGLVGPARMAPVASDCATGGGTRSKTQSSTEVYDGGVGAGVGGRFGVDWRSFAADGPGHVFWGAHVGTGADVSVLEYGRHRSRTRTTGDCDVTQPEVVGALAYAVQVPLTLGLRWAFGAADADTAWSGVILGIGAAPTLLFAGGAADHLTLNPAGFEVSLELAELHAAKRASQLEFTLGVLPALTDDQPWSFALRAGWMWH